MASTKRPTYKGAATISPRKRRKSDLVIMWQSILDVTTLIGNELWFTLLGAWSFIQTWFTSSEQFEIQAWVEKFLSFAPGDFSHCWRDGLLLGMLLNKLQPGCFPDSNRLDPDYGIENMHKAFDVMEMYFGIIPNVPAEEIVTCAHGSEQKLLKLLSELKKWADNHQENGTISVTDRSENIEEPCVSHCCLAKGTGLTIGFVGKASTFMIFCSPVTDLDIVVQIKGPNTICSERITNKSPRKKSSVHTWDYSRPLKRSVSLNDKCNSLVSDEDKQMEKSIIPMEYEINGNQINVSYKPKEKGKHLLKILWHGQHVSDSPYTVFVENPTAKLRPQTAIAQKSALKPVCESDKRKISVRFEESRPCCNESSKRIGKIRSKRVLRYIVRIHGEDVPVDAESTESLATELLKMDYNFEKYPSFHRRYSWGFTGDAERKKSVIRQFGVDERELEAQSSSRRSRSFSMQASDGLILEKSNSLDNLPSKLHVVNEDVYENRETEHDENKANSFYMNEELKLVNKDGKKESNKQKIQNTITPERKISKSEFETNSLKESSGANYDNNELESGKISSSSTKAGEVNAVDDSNDGLIEKLSENSISTFNDISNSNYSSLEFSDSKKLNNKVAKNIYLNFPPFFQESIKNKVFKNIPQLKRIQNHHKYVPVYRRRKTRNQRTVKNKNLTFHIKVPKIESSVYVSRIIVFRKDCMQSKYKKSKSIPFLISCKVKRAKFCSKIENTLFKDLNKYSNFEMHSNMSFKKPEINSCKNHNGDYFRKRKSLSDNNQKRYTFMEYFIDTHVANVNKNAITDGTESYAIDEPAALKNIYIIVDDKNDVQKFDTKRTKHLNDNVNLESKFSDDTQNFQTAATDENVVLKHNLHLRSENQSHLQEPSLNNLNPPHLKNTDKSNCFIKDPVFSLDNLRVCSRNINDEQMSTVKKPEILHDDLNSCSKIIGSSKLTTNELTIPKEDNLKVCMNGIENKLKSTVEDFRILKNNLNPCSKSVDDVPKSVMHNLKDNVTHNNACEYALYESTVLKGNFNAATLPRENGNEYSNVKNNSAFAKDSMYSNSDSGTLSTSSSHITSKDIKDINQKLKTHKLKNIEQFHFKQFNTFLEAQNSIRPVKSQIVQWENSLGTENQNTSSNKTYIVETELGNVKEKLAFWETARKDSSNFPKETESRQNKQIHIRTDRKHYDDAISSSSDSEHHSATGVSVYNQDNSTMKSKDNCENIRLKTSPVKISNDELSTEIIHHKHDTHSSFSDSGAIEAIADKFDNEYPTDASLSSFSNEYLYSSKDDNLDKHKSDIESCSDRTHFSEDEYIDDDIPDGTGEYWGDIGDLKDFKLIGREARNSFWNEIYTKHCCQPKSNPEVCKVFGIGVYYGRVAVKNKFQVFTENAGFGSLAVSIQGLGQHDVIFISVVYVRNDVYEITYQVLNAGYYLISIRWMDNDIQGSPFLCKVTY